ncbi:uncharacterized protein [Littorina saxatilis]|uniref:uncharacterized protein isoform X1 n=1 Tax=Littorina saxatilis TaxID=31220 RepID=UPI0038B62AA1
MLRQLLTLLAFLCYSPVEGVATCNMPSVQVGADTMLTCNFTNTLNADKPDVLVKHKALNSSKWTDVLDCYRNPEIYQCDIADTKFVLISGPSETIVLGLTNSTKATQGTYKCFCLPETVGAYQPCTFMLDPTPPSTLTINPTALTLTTPEEFSGGTVTAPEEFSGGTVTAPEEGTEKANSADDIVISLGVVIPVAIGASMVF